MGRSLYEQSRVIIGMDYNHATICNANAVDVSVGVVCNMDTEWNALIYFLA